MMRRTRDWAARLLVVLLVTLAALGPTSQASAAEWVQNFVPTELWSGPDRGAVSFGLAPQWDYFQVAGPPVGTRMSVLVARSGNYAFIETSVVGPSGPPPVGWPFNPATPASSPDVQSTNASLTSNSQVGLSPLPGFAILADQALWPALQALQLRQHTWTLQAFSLTGTRLEWGSLPPDSAGAYQPARSLVTVNERWSRSDARALAAVLEHEGKHVADLLAGLDVQSPSGCMITEINAFHEEAKTWGEFVGPNGKPDPRDELEESLNFKLSLSQKGPDAVERYVLRSPGYRTQCRVH